jgi:hypothetical protein
MEFWKKEFKPIAEHHLEIRLLVQITYCVVTRQFLNNRPQKIPQFCAKTFSRSLRADEDQKILDLNINILQAEKILDYQSFAHAFHSSNCLPFR